MKLRLRPSPFVLTLSALVLVLVVVLAVVVWNKAFRSEPQTFTAEAANFSQDDMRFAYGTLGADAAGGIPYPIFMILPRVFPDLAAKYAVAGYGPAKQSWGGYAAFGLSWEQGQRLPIGLSIRRVGYERVTANCALCHTTRYRLSASDDERFALAGPGSGTDVQALLRFLAACANDRRFTPERLMPEIALHFPLDAADGAMYSAWLIPKTRTGLQLIGHELAFADSRTAWGPGRDDAFNLPKFILAQLPVDDSVSNTDFPALWKLGQRDGGLFHAAGEAHDLETVIATSALGTGAAPNSPAKAATNDWIARYIRAKAPPPFPGPIDAALAGKGHAVFQAQCASCHVAGQGRTGTGVPQAEVGTDPAHIQTWTQHDADRTNLVATGLGFLKAKFYAPAGYVAKPLVGVWLLGPYLHNGSVPTITALLPPPAQRPQVFWRGYDVIDQQALGFVSSGPDAEAQGFRFDTRLKGNGNGGHAYGVNLVDDDKHALIEYLKTL